MKKLTFLFLFGFLFQIGLLAQFTISGEIRPRSEYRHGVKTLANEDQDAAFFTDQRSRLNFDFKAKKTKLFISLQDVRTWGNQSQLVVNNGLATGVHQAWAKISLDEKWAMKLGRQEIFYDDQRIFGNVGWAQQARSHDAALLIFQDSTFKGHLGLAFNQNSPQLVGTSYSIPKNYKSIQYVWLHKDWNQVKGSLLVLNNGVQVNFANGDFETNFSQTIGGRIGYAKNKFSSNFSLYYQGGTNADTLDRKINAFYFGLDASLKVEKNVIFTIGTEILSGNDQLNNNGENNAFTPFYGTNHKFNGLMDYFYVGNHIGNVGLNDLYAKVAYKKNKFDASIALHYFLTNSNIQIPQDIGNSADTYLGTELDFVLGWKLKSGAAFKMGYSQMFGSETMEILKGGDRNATNNWVWAMVTVKPSFTFKNK